MRKKIILIIIFIIQALPIPLSLISLIGTMISVADMGETMFDFTFLEVIQAIFVLSTMFLAGTYLITYSVSLGISLTKISKEQKIGWLCFLPSVHLIVTIFLIVLLLHAG